MKLNFKSFLSKPFIIYFIAKFMVGVIYGKNLHALVLVLYTYARFSIIACYILL